MNTFFSKQSWLIWAVLFLLILNASIVGTILYRNLRTDRVQTPVPLSMPMHRQAPGAYLKEELGLSDEQFRQFRESRNQYQARVMEMNHRIGLTRRNYLQELMRPEPDTLHMRLTRDSIGRMHASLMEETGRYYHQIREVCREEQVEKLNDFFIQAVEIEAGPGMPPGWRRSVLHSSRRNRGN